ncbi:MAG: hypothetical protein ACSLFM_10105 [Tepidiformaceae bacterium]
MDQGVCDLGAIEFRWQAVSPLVAVLDGHGVVVYGEYNAKTFGTIDASIPALRVGPDGMDVGDGNLVRHNGKVCGEGRRAGRR